MLCDNCKKREANVRYLENINGIKNEMHLCEECSRKLGITDKMQFKMPSLDLSGFFGSFFGDFIDTSNLLPQINDLNEIQCDSCGTTFENIIHTGKYGCPNCYDVFEDRMDPILKKLQGANRHNGRLGKISNNKMKFEKKNEDNIQNNELNDLKEQLKKAIKEERYEDAARIRDEINGNNQ